MLTYGDVYVCCCLQHLVDRLEAVKMPEALRLDMSDDNALRVLADCEAKLERLMQVFKKKMSLNREP
jgi:hypothetical protein